MTSRWRRSKKIVAAELPAPAADLGLLDRRTFLTGAVKVAGLVAAGNLFLNGIIGPEARMDAKTLPRLKMPNRDGFVNYCP